MDRELNFVFTKKGAMKYISHLDLLRLFSRAIRRAGLPAKMTQGYNPHFKLSIKRALKLGIESENEEAAVVLTRLMDCDEFKTRLQPQLPEGIVIKNYV